ncbi:MAG: hypothetical protein AAF597_08170, partial [Bacteroidota bacterium]
MSFYTGTWWLIGCFLFAAVFWPVSQGVNGQSDRPKLNFLSEADGLPAGGTYYLYHDLEGFIWIGTKEGLFRYDGRQLHPYQHDPNQPFSLSENQISSECFEDRSGDLWFTTTESLQKWERKTERFLAYHHPGAIKGYKLFHQGRDGKLWLRIGEGVASTLWFFDPETEVFSPSISITGRDCFLIEHPQTDTPAFLAQTALYLNPGMSVTDLSNEVTQNVVPERDNCGNLAPRASPTQGFWSEGDTVVWTGAYNGILRYEIGKPDSLGVLFRWCPDDPQNEVIGFVSSIIPYNDDYLLVAGDTDLYLFDHKAQKFTGVLFARNEEQQDLPYALPDKLFLDRQNGIWITTIEGGIVFFSSDKQKFSSIAGSAGQTINALSQGPGGKVWVSTLTEGLYTIDPDDGKSSPSLTYVLDGYDDPPTAFLSADNFLGRELDDWWVKVANQFSFWDEGEGCFHFADANGVQVPNSSEDRLGQWLARANGEQLITFGRSVVRLTTKDNRVALAPWHDLTDLQLAPVSFLAEDDAQNLLLNDEAGRLVILQDDGNTPSIVAEHEDVGT